MSRQRRKGTRRRQAEAAAAPTAQVSGWLQDIQRFGPGILLLAIFAVVMLVRMRFAGVPFERDEGEYAYAGQLILQGIPPYELAYNMKFPGTYYAYALIMAVFGQTIEGVHYGLLVVHLATAWFVYLLARRYFGRFAAIAGATGFAVFGVDRWIMGVWAHATHFVLLPAIAGLVLLHRGIDRDRRVLVLGSGVLLGMAVLMKQHGFLFLVAASVVCLLREFSAAAFDPRRLLVRVLWLGAGAALPLLLLVSVLGLQGVLEAFTYWTFEYAARYVSLVTLSDGWNVFLANLSVVTRSNALLWALAVGGWVAWWISPRQRGHRLELSVIVVASALAIVPGFYFRPHYFILLLPALALGIASCAALLENVSERILGGSTARALAATLVIAVFGAYAWNEREYLVEMSPRDLSRARYGPNPFIESVEIAGYLRRHSDPGDRIAVLGSEPQIYFYANRKSATGFIYTYPIMEDHDLAREMQEQMIREIETAQPRYLVIIDFQGSWVVRSASERLILEWMVQFWTQCYDKVGVGEPISNEHSEIHWDEAASGYQAQTEWAFYVLRKKSEGYCALRNPLEFLGSE